MNYERYIASDGLPDDRVTCRACTCMDRRNHCTVDSRRTMPDLPRRCIHFVPLPSVLDQRHGALRWPGLADEIAEVRRIDEAFMESRR